MSLVNKVLRDLDARRAGDTERSTLPPAVMPLQPGEAAISRTRIAALLVVSVLAAGAVATYFGFRPALDLPRMSSEPAHSKIVASPPKIAAAVPVAVPAVAPPAPPPAIAEAIPPSVAAPVTPAAAPVAIPAAAPTPGLPASGDLALKLDSGLAGIPEPRKPAAAPPPPPAPTKPAAKAEPAPAETPRKEKSATPAEAPKAATPKTDTPKAVAPKAAPPAASPARAAAPEASIDKQMSQHSAAEKAETEFRRGQAMQRQGATDEAAARYRTALVEQPEHTTARRVLANLLIEHRRHEEAEELLRGGIALFPTQAYWPMALARLRVERGDTPGALDILKKHAAAGEASAEYQGFAGALQQRGGHHAEAADRYRAASRLAPNEARWWAGLGIALESAGKATEARAAYERARVLPGLPAELSAHIEQRLR